MDRIQRLFQAQAQAQGGGGPAADAPVVDTAELVYISSMALLKMLKHGRKPRHSLPPAPPCEPRLSA